MEWMLRQHLAPCPSRAVKAVPISKAEKKEHDKRSEERAQGGNVGAYLRKNPEHEDRVRAMADNWRPGVLDIIITQ